MTTKMTILPEAACAIFYNPKGRRDHPRGWYVREYHSNYAMDQHLKGKKGFDGSYVEHGVFRTKE
jgi:hypothetical protein